MYDVPEGIRFLDFRSYETTRKGNSVYNHEFFKV